jgi:hypothetical protein
MGHRDSYLWRLRQAVGSDLILMPGAMVAVQRDDQRILLTKRADGLRERGELLDIQQQLVAQASVEGFRVWVVNRLQLRPMATLSSEASG